MIRSTWLRFDGCLLPAAGSQDFSPGAPPLRVGAFLFPASADRRDISNFSIV